MGLAATESQLQANRALWAPLARSGGLSDLFARPQPAASTCWSRKRQVVAVVVASCVHHRVMITHTIELVAALVGAHF